MVFDLAVITQLEFMDRLLDSIDGGAEHPDLEGILDDFRTGFLSQWLEDGGQVYAHLDEFRRLRYHHEDFIHCVSWVLQDLKWGTSPSRRLVLRHAIQDASAATISSLWHLKARVRSLGAHLEPQPMAI
jgi:hypothetical protein